MSILSYDEAIVELGKLTSSGKYTVTDLMSLGIPRSVINDFNYPV